MLKDRDGSTFVAFDELYINFQGSSLDAEGDLQDGLVRMELELSD